MLKRLRGMFTRGESQPAGTTWHPHLGGIGGQTLADVLPLFPGAVPRRSIVLATSERTGSEWLCEIMGGTGVMGRPSEYLNTYWMRRFIPDYPEDVPSQIALARRFGVTANGCLAIKMHPWHFDRLPGDAVFSSFFPDPRFVFLTREDHLGQAISLVRARQTEKFHSITSETRPAEYDARQIEDALGEVIVSQARWSKFFSRNGIQPLRLSYEDFAEKPEETLKRIAAFAGVSIPFARHGIRARLSVQRDGTSHAWRERFLSEKRDLNRLDGF
ncbi:Stf0 family sulfotransferase [Acidocella sp.]|uniref:Stf0 family sulfotransferase n=1 Tax=Acidocella sp. TaxID=50710 RepID=UPI003D056B6B